MGVRFKKIALIAGCVILLLFAGANMAISQTLPPLYYSLVNNEKEAVVTYLTQIRPLSVFQSEFLRYKNTYGLWVEEQVFKKEWERNAKIIRLEEALKKNPKSRDILYGLSVLYGERGDGGKALQYLEKAKTIDPAVN